MTPLRDWLLITPVEVQEGLILVREKEKSAEAIVVKVGKDVKQIKPGDTVWHNKLGYEFNFGTETVYLIQEGDIYGKAT